MYRDILVPTDGSTSARQALEHAIDLAEANDATIHAVYVVNPGYSADEGLEYLLEALESEGERTVENAQEIATQRGVTMRTEILRGTPYREILDYANGTDIDLIVMGTQGRTGLDRYLLGSVTEKVVRLSDVPVLTVRRSDDGDE